MQQGIAILDRYSYLLSEKGRELALRADELFSAAGNSSHSEEIINRVEELRKNLPTLENPHLEVFRKPDISPFMQAKEKGAKSFIVEISKGCENQCVFCSVEAPRKMVFMPDLMFLLVVEAVRGIGGKISFDIRRTDPLLYRGILFGTNFGDLLEVIQDIFEPFLCRHRFLSSHGWPKNYKFAQAAAEKMNQIGIGVEQFSLHLFHREFQQPIISETVLDEYAERFAQAIILLRPCHISLLGTQEARVYNAALENIPPPFTLAFVKRFFRERVLPRLIPELRQKYEGHKEAVRERKVISFGSGLYAGFKRDRLPRCNNCEEMPGAVMIIYPDGSYSLEEKEKVPRQKGKLF